MSRCDGGFCHSKSRWGRTVWLSLLMGAVAVIWTAQARAEMLRVVAIEIPLMIESPEEGLFIELLMEIDRRSELDFQIEVFPGSRAHLMFRAGEADVLMPFPKGAASAPGLMTAPIYLKRDFAFVRTGTVPPTNLKDLQGLRVGLTRQYKYPDDLLNDPKIYSEYANSDEVNMAKLAAGRIDVFLVEEDSGQAAIRKAGVTGIKYDPHHPVTEAEVVLVLTASQQGQRWVQEINDVLKEMQHDGTFYRLTQGEKKGTS